MLLSFLFLVQSKQHFIVSLPYLFFYFDCVVWFFFKIWNHILSRSYDWCCLGRMGEIQGGSTFGHGPNAQSHIRESSFQFDVWEAKFWQTPTLCLCVNELINMSHITLDRIKVISYKEVEIKLRVKWVWVNQVTVIQTVLGECDSNSSCYFTIGILFICVRSTMDSTIGILFICVASHCMTWMTSCKVLLCCSLQ